MTAVVILGLIALGLLTYIAYQQDRHDKERARLLGAFEAERKELLNRIQVPEAAPFMASEAKLQHVPFDDDEAFEEATEEWQ